MIKDIYAVLRPHPTSWMVFNTAEIVKAEGGVRFGQKGLMMELQSLQEALKVEIQIHQKLVAQMKQDPQNAELKLQLHDLQAKITVLSERQKKVVEQLRRDLLVKQDSAEIRLQAQTQLPLQADGKTTTLITSQNQNHLAPAHLNIPQNSVSVTPVMATKTLPLMLKAATPSTPIAMMPTPTIAMVTTLTSMSRANSDPQNSPISLQVAGKITNQGTEPMRIVPKNTIVVMPKTSVAQAALQPVLASTQQPVLLTAKLSSTLLPSTGPVHQLHIFNPGNNPPGSNSSQSCPNNVQPGFNIIQPCPSITMTLSTNLTQLNTSSVQQNAQLPSIIFSTQSNKPHIASLPQGNIDLLATNKDTACTDQRRVACEDVLIQGEAKTAELQTSVNSTTTSLTPQQSSVSLADSTTLNQQNSFPETTQTTTPKCQDNPVKLAFMLSLGLVTQGHLDEIQSKSQERKRRTTANPVYSRASIEPEHKKSTLSYLNSTNQRFRKNG